ncbi:hypothetical protein L7F22_065138 [Adiantum nelumboides]|nr:hypothetical protein [Adiantum nelumboides]
MDMLLKEGIEEALTFSDDRIIERSPRSSDIGKRAYHLPALNVEEELKSSRRVSEEGRCVHQHHKEEITPQFRSSTDLLALIRSCGKQKDLLYGRECVEPNLVTFVVLLTACSHVGLVEEGQTLFIIMSSVYNIHASIEHYNCIVDLLSRAGHLDEAVGVIKKFDASNSVLLFSALLGGCQNWSNVDIGGWVFNFAIQGDQHLAAAYVGMSNTYAAASLQQEGFKKRECMGQ